MEGRKDLIGVIIGRFQPLHLGHAWLIKEALKKFDKLIILIGSSNIADKNNPWNLKTRKKIIEKFLEKEKLSKKVIRITDVIDVPDDDKWLEIALKKINIKDFIVVGDNEWVNGIFEKEGFEVWRTGFFQREIYQGRKIRDLFSAGKDWRERIPEYVVKFLE